MLPLLNLLHVVIWCRFAWVGWWSMWLIQKLALYRPPLSGYHAHYLFCPPTKLLITHVISTSQKNNKLNEKCPPFYMQFSYDDVWTGIKDRSFIKMLLIVFNWCFMRLDSCFTNIYTNLCFHHNKNTLFLFHKNNSLNLSYSETSDISPQACVSVIDSHRLFPMGGPRASSWPNHHSIL